MGKEDKQRRKRLPEWIRIQYSEGKSFQQLDQLTKKENLNTICISGKCPNRGECWSAGHATFMILGDICTRSCKFCGTLTGKPLAPDPDEPQRLAKSIKRLGLKHCIITSVDRDDLPDKGSSFWAEVIKKIRELNPEVTIETLIPDFSGNTSFLNNVIETSPDIISHNLETVRRLTPLIRSAAEYDRSLKVLHYVSSRGVITKSGIMLGLGESHDEVLTTMDDLLEAGCRIMTLGQYLQPSLSHLNVEKYIHPEVFDKYRETGLRKGFDFVESGPLVRTSYKADKHIQLKKRQHES